MTTTTWRPGMPTSDMHAGQVPMQTGYQLASHLLGDVMQTEAPDQLVKWQALQAGKDPQVLVVDGCYDHMHLILEASGIPFARLGEPALLAAALEEHPMVKAVLINCGRTFPEASARTAAAFVERGGLLVTTDWALENVLEVGFPGTVKHNGKTTDGHVFVDVEFGDPRKKALPAPSLASHRVMAKLAGASSAKPRWWLEPTSYPIARLTDDLDILIYSPQMKTGYGSGSVMVRFRHGAGWVYHMVSHAFLQHKAPGDWAKASADPNDAPSTVLYTSLMGASPKTTEAYEAAEQADPEFDEAAAANTSLSTAALLLPIFEATKLDTDTGR